MRWSSSASLPSSHYFIGHIERQSPTFGDLRSTTSMRTTCATTETPRRWHGATAPYVIPRNAAAGRGCLVGGPDRDSESISASPARDVSRGLRERALERPPDRRLAPDGMRFSSAARSSRCPPRRTWRSRPAFRCPRGAALERKAVAPAMTMYPRADRRVTGTMRRIAAVPRKPG
jgi:hypothetical protein